MNLMPFSLSLLDFPYPNQAMSQPVALAVDLTVAVFSYIDTIQQISFPILL